MGIKGHAFDVEGDVEGHAAGRMIEVKRLKVETTDGHELTLEPEGEEGDRYRIVSGPEDLVGHGAKWG